MEVLVFGPEFVTRMDPIMDRIPGVKMLFFVGREVPAYAEDCCRLVTFCSSSAPPVALTDDDDAAIYFSSGTTGLSQGHPAQAPFPHQCLHDGAASSWADPQRRVPVHSAPVPYRRENALVWQPGFRQQGGAAAGRETRVDTSRRDGGKVHHCLAAGALVRRICWRPSKRDGST